MNDIVEAALESEPRRTSGDALTEQQASEFSAPSFALVGCGPVGIARITDTPDWTASGFADTHVEFDVTTVALGLPPHPGTTDVDEELSIKVSATPTDADALSETTPVELESRLQAELPACELAIVTTHLAEPATGNLAAAAARSFPPETTVVTMPTVPPDGLPPNSKGTFHTLVTAAGTTMPVDLARVNDAFGHAPTKPAATSEEAVLDVAGAVIGNVIQDLFMLVQAPLSAPVDRQRVHALLTTGGVALPYWGWGTGETEPAALLADAAAHRLCDGDRATVTGGLGFLRFGEPFTLAAFEGVRADIAETFGAPDSETDRWVVGGQATPGLGEEYRLALLLLGVDPASLPFLNDAE